MVAAGDAGHALRRFGDRAKAALAHGGLVDDFDSGRRFARRKAEPAGAVGTLVDVERRIAAVFDADFRQGGLRQRARSR